MNFFIALLKPGVNIVLTIAENACSRVLKIVLELSTYRLQMFLVKYEDMGSLRGPWHPWIAWKTWLKPGSHKSQ